MADGNTLFEPHLMYQMGILQVGSCLREGGLISTKE